eukprot:1138021-Pelagomonas_calceolata.AAC.1
MSHRPGRHTMLQEGAFCRTSCSSCTDQAHPVHVGLPWQAHPAPGKCTAARSPCGSPPPGKKTAASHSAAHAAHPACRCGPART